MKGDRDSIIRLRKEGEFHVLFDEQIRWLRNHGLPLEECDALLKKREAVVSHALEMNIPGGHYPFLPILNVPYDWYVQNLYGPGITAVNEYIAFSEITDQIEVIPRRYTFDIAKGGEFYYKAPEKAVQKGLLFLTFKELLLYYIFNSEVEPFAHKVSPVAALGSHVITEMGEYCVPDIYEDPKVKDMDAEYIEVNYELSLNALLFGDRISTYFPYCRERA